MGDTSLHSMARLISELDKLPNNVKKYYDLKDTLATWNGITQYYIHVSRFRKWDYLRALYLKNTPRVTIITHPFFTHGVTGTLATDNRLKKCFEFPYIENSNILKSCHFLKIIIMQYFRKILRFIAR